MEECFEGESGAGHKYFATARRQHAIILLPSRVFVNYKQRGRERQRERYKIIDLILYSHTFRQNKKEAHESYKQEKGKRKVENSAAVFVDVPVLAAFNLGSLMMRSRMIVYY